MKELAPDFITLYRSPYPDSLYCYSPAIIRLDSGRLVATIDIRDTDQQRKEQGLCTGWYHENDRSAWLGKLYTSDDGGQSWVHRIDFPFLHARPFASGSSLYLLGHAGDLKIMRSDDNGESWGNCYNLSQGQRWHQAPCNVLYANGCIYLVMEREMYDFPEKWKVIDLAPVLMRGRIGDDLTIKKNWSFASEICYRELRERVEPNLFGVPFYAYDPCKTELLASGRPMHPVGLLEANVVQFTDPRHIWHDPSGKTIHILSRAHTGWVNQAGLLKVVERADGSMETVTERLPSGREILFINLPGGQMKFHLLWDQQTRLYWLLSSQSTDSMVDIHQMDPERFDLPNNERNRLVLHFSINCIDWCFAGVVAIGPGHRQSRHYASMCVDGEDLLVLSRSGDEQSKTAHDTNMITLHRVKDFRQLVY